MSVCLYVSVYFGVYISVCKCACVLAGLNRMEKEFAENMNEPTSMQALGRRNTGARPA